jgi:type II restriction enzyme
MRDGMRRMMQAHRTLLSNDVGAAAALLLDSRVADLDVRYLPYSTLAEQRTAIARFGTGLKPIEAIARRLK